MFRIFYHLVLVIFSAIKLPFVLFEMVTKGKYRKSFFYRFGLAKQKVQPMKGKVVWIHAVSVGETKAVSALAKWLHEEKEMSVVVSSGTETGQAEAKRSIPFAEAYLYLPMDFDWIVNPLVSSINPSLLVISETDYWYNLLFCCKNAGAKIVAVNAKLSEKTCLRYQKLSWLSKKIFPLLDLICTQNEIYSQRFESLGIKANKIVATGNTKFDADITNYSEKEKQAFKEKLGIAADKKIVVVGSTHDTEEEFILKAFEPLLNDTVLVLVPRHPERFSTVAKLLQGKGLRHTVYSSAKVNDPQVVLIDAMGLLKKCYSIADVAIVAGSFVEHVGGHNILEPSGYGVPVVFGPYMHSQPELLKMALENEVGIQSRKESLLSDIKKLLGSKKLCDQLGENGRLLISQSRGATKKTLKSLEKINACT